MDFIRRLVPVVEFHIKASNASTASFLAALNSTRISSNFLTEVVAIDEIHSVLSCHGIRHTNDTCCAGLRYAFSKS